jgi:hypothetical protein
MELQARVTALEEEVGILKGEIKTILQEVRVAILARENPFLEEAGEGPVSAANVNFFALDEPPPVRPVMSEAPAQPAPASPVAATPPAAAANVEPTPIRTAARIEATEPEPVFEAPQARTASDAGIRPLDLAALLTWVQETTERFSESDFAILLSIGTYGDLIDDELKETLMELSQQLPSNESHKASLSEFTLALQQLSALMEQSAAKPNSRRPAA